MVPSEMAGTTISQLIEDARFDSAGRSPAITQTGY
jgi:hypothetical protein